MKAQRKIRLTLVLCEQCLAKVKVICKQEKLATIWEFHPWWRKAQKCAYDEFIYEDELSEWKPV